VHKVFSVETTDLLPSGSAGEEHYPQRKQLQREEAERCTAFSVQRNILMIDFIYMGVIITKTLIKND